MRAGRDRTIARWVSILMEIFDRPVGIKVSFLKVFRLGFRVWFLIQISDKILDNLSKSSSPQPVPKSHNNVKSPSQEFSSLGSSYSSSQRWKRNSPDVKMARSPFDGSTKRIHSNTANRKTSAQERNCSPAINFHSVSLKLIFFLMSCDLMNFFLHILEPSTLIPRWICITAC